MQEQPRLHTISPRPLLLAMCRHGVERVHINCHYCFEVVVFPAAWLPPTSLPSIPASATVAGG